MIAQSEWIGLTNTVIRSVYIELAMEASGLKFAGPELVLADSRQDKRRGIRSSLVNQHCVSWRGLGDSQRQAREVISGPCMGAKARFLSFNRTISRAVTGFPNGYNTLRNHLQLMWLSVSPYFRRRGAKDETSAYILR